MKKNIFCKTIIFFVLALVFSCSQDPIFHTISTEPIPVKPRIQGGPTNIAVFEREYSDPDNGNITKVPIMYVASGKLYWYARAERGNGAPGWNLSEYRIPQPSGKVIGLAATGEYLYALCIVGTGVTTELRRIGPNLDDKWEIVQIDSDVARFRLIQSIYAVTTGTTGRLFAGAMNVSGSDYGILYLDNDTLKLLEIKDNEGKAVNTEMLSGAASRYEASVPDTVHYLSTRGKGVYKVADTALGSGLTESDVQLPECVRKKDENNNDIMEPTGRENRLFMNMIQLKDDLNNDVIIVIERNGGTFFEVRENGFTRIRYSRGATVSSGRFATGALAFWQEVIRDDNGTPQPREKRMLIAGIQGSLFSTTTTSSFTHGYVEIELDKNFTFDSFGWLELQTPRTNISPNTTVNGNTDRYTATIGKHPINHMYQTSQEIDANMTFFASTQTAGLWSYRNREGGWQWNAEGENEPRNEP